MITTHDEDFDADAAGKEYLASEFPDSELVPAPGSEGEDQSDDLNVICPYCLYAYQAESEDYDEDERKVICGKCDREFLLRDECSVTHYTRPFPQNSD